MFSTESVGSVACSGCPTVEARKLVEDRPRWWFSHHFEARDRAYALFVRSSDTEASAAMDAAPRSLSAWRAPEGLLPMRSCMLFPADEILRRANTISLKLYRDQGKTIGISFELSGDLLNPFEEADDEGDLCGQSDEAHKLLAALLAEGGAV